ncbi:MAG: CpsB/CapC family capsule biosynthesis tyrosine phosphatase, partial [Lachnospiraceae bacterium]|nr:CpsB/CapC family capsule biosynthesis tyrosine phosphatase [Lachnospiraceae bacterium]
MNLFQAKNIVRMVDTHMHIIPGVDDGSKTMDMSKAMLDAAYEQGIRHIIATPHSSAFRNNSDKVFSEFARLSRYAKTVYPDMMLKIGAEVLFTKD